MKQLQKNAGFSLLMLLIAMLASCTIPEAIESGGYSDEPTVLPDGYIYLDDLFLEHTSCTRDIDPGARTMGGPGVCWTCHVSCNSTATWSVSNALNVIDRDYEEGDCTYDSEDCGGSFGDADWKWLTADDVVLTSPNAASPSGNGNFSVTMQVHSYGYGFAGYKFYIGGERMAQETIDISPIQVSSTEYKIKPSMRLWGAGWIKVKLTFTTIDTCSGMSTDNIVYYEFAGEEE